MGIEGEAFYFRWTAEKLVGWLNAHLRSFLFHKELASDLLEGIS